jgi:hypothetical protein
MGKLVKSLRLGRKVLPVRVRVAPPSFTKVVCRTGENVRGPGFPLPAPNFAQV